MAQATSTNANHRTESRSHRTCRRLKQPSHDSDRSTFQRCRPSLPAILDPGGAVDLGGGSLVLADRAAAPEG
jgi:hypothetical protein